MYPQLCFLHTNVQHAALLFTEATRMGNVLRAVNAINPRKRPISSAAFTYSAPGLGRIIL